MFLFSLPPPPSHICLDHIPEYDERYSEIVWQYSYSAISLITYISSIMKDADIVPKVIEYLSKKGYSRTEAMLRIESANQDVESRPINARAEETGGVKYIRAFGEHRVNDCSFVFTLNRTQN